MLIDNCKDCVPDENNVHTCSKEKDVSQDVSQEIARLKIGLKDIFNLANIYCIDARMGQSILDKIVKVAEFYLEGK